jgi:hypothetical protein
MWRPKLTGHAAIVRSINDTKDLIESMKKSAPADKPTTNVVTNNNCGCIFQSSIDAGSITCKVDCENEHLKRELVQLKEAFDNLRDENEYLRRRIRDYTIY